MSDYSQSQGRATILVGMDAHTRVLSLCVAEWRHGSDPTVRRKFPEVLLEDMEKVYERWIPKDALTLVEASGNTRVIVKRLRAIGRKVEVLNSDILHSVSERDKVNDRIDAEKLTFAYARGNANGRSVWIPSEEYAGYRDLIAGYIRSSRDTVRCSNRLWAFCNSHGLPLPNRGRARKREDCPIGKWARHKLASGKEYNKVCMAAARKVITYAWHILNGVPSPNRDMQTFYERKLGSAYAEVGREEMTKIGYPTRSSFVSAVSNEVYAHLPERSAELQS